MTISPANLYKLFFRYSPLAMIPVVAEEKICTFISKTKVITEFNAGNFKDRPLLESINLMIENSELNHFFEQLEQIPDDKKIEKIPLVDAEKENIIEVKLDQFYQDYRPIEEIKKENFEWIINQFEVPMIIVNSRGRLIYKNEITKKLYRFLQRENEVRKKNILEYFPKNFIEIIKSQDADKIYKLETRTKILKYRVQTLTDKIGVLYLVHFAI